MNSEKSRVSIMEIMKNLENQELSADLAQEGKELLPIFALRVKCFKKINPEYCRTDDGERMIVLSSLVAQDMIATGVGQYSCVDRILLDNLHKKRGIYRGDDVHPCLVTDLVAAFLKDLNAQIINRAGEIIRPERLRESKVLDVIHDSQRHGIPKTALDTL